MTAPTGGEQTCPRCGTSTAGAPWCPACGLNLRLHTPETPPPEAPPAPETPPPETSPALETHAPEARPAPPPPMSALTRSDPSRKRLVALIAGVLVLGGAIAAVSLLAFRSSSPPSVAAAKTVVETVAVTDVVTDGNASTLPPVTVDEMRNELGSYMQAYDDESVVELGNLFAPDLVRRNGADPVENRDAALATYQQQFDELTNPQYQLTDVTYRTGQGEGIAEGRYVITSSAGQSQGRIGFEFVVRDGFLYIDKIGIAPS